ncbi:MAG: hypothetical protein IPI67_26675 [Myxococcales bacterium]|nr:hypothetical protein [Myxococcales bacterium]
MHRVDIDALYSGYCDSVPGEIRPVAQELAHRLGLAPVPGVPWSQVFGNAVTLAAPALVAEAFPRAEPAMLRLAVLAHMLAVIEAFGADRLADRQVCASGPLLGALQEVRNGRDRALHELDATASYEVADQRSRAAMAGEREWLARVLPASYPTYARLSLDKQAVGFAASVALARASGGSPAQVVTLERLLADVWLGLQHHDDVVDWEDDWERGGAWAVCLARGAPAGFTAAEAHAIRHYVLGSGVLALLLERSRRHYRGAWRRARAIGALGLAAWAQERHEKLTALCRAEKASAGYAVRLFRLAPFAAEVLR